MDAAQVLKEANLPPQLLKDRGVYINTTRRGISGGLVKAIAQVYDKRDLLVKVLGTSKANLNRVYKTEVLSPMASESVLDLLRIFDFAAEVFGDRTKADTWLNTSIPALNGEIPVNLCDTAEGRNLVREALLAIEYGEFS